MVGRYAIAVVLGVVITFGVLIMMQALIATAKAELDESGTRHFVDFVRVERQQEIAKKDRRPEKPPEPAQAPPDAPQPRLDSIDPVASTVNIAPVEVQADIEIGGLGLAQSDGEYLPIVRIAPVYPWKAQTQGIEGYCIVEFTVTEAGTVKDVVVVDAQPPGIFDKASMEAALKFKYRPRIVNGEPIQWFEEFQVAVRDRPGESVDVTYERAGTTTTATVEIGSRTGDNEFGEAVQVGFVGVAPWRLAATLGVPFLDGPAGRAGLRSGDEVVAVGDTEVEGWTEFERAYLAASGAEGERERLDLAEDDEPHPAPAPDALHPALDADQTAYKGLTGQRAEVAAALSKLAK